MQLVLQGDQQIGRGVNVSAEARAALHGAQWLALEQALSQAAPFGPTLQAAGLHSGELKPQLRALLHYHCGVNTLRTRQLMIDLQAL